MQTLFGAFSYTSKNHPSKATSTYALLADEGEHLLFASKILFEVSRYQSGLAVVVLDLLLFLVAGRLCRRAPAEGSFSTEYSCLRVWRARNPRAPRQTFAGQALRIRVGEVSVRPATGVTGLAICCTSSAISFSSAPSLRRRPA